MLGAVGLGPGHQSGGADEVDQRLVVAGLDGVEAVLATQVHHLFDDEVSCAVSDATLSHPLADSRRRARGMRRCLRCRAQPQVCSRETCKHKGGFVRCE